MEQKDRRDHRSKLKGGEREGEGGRGRKREREIKSREPASQTERPGKEVG